METILTIAFVGVVLYIGYKWYEMHRSAKISSTPTSTGGVTSGDTSTTEETTSGPKGKQGLK